MPRFLWSIAAGLALLFTGAASANECYSKFPAGIAPIGGVKLCQSDLSGLKVLYSCQDYRQGDQFYRVIYQGGLEPKAIVKLDPTAGEQLIWSPGIGDPDEMRCPLPAPVSIPKQASHRGLGICQDENNASIPCSVYEHTPVRQSRTYRYLVFYQQNGGGSKLAHRMVTGNNQDAMVAELAYQLGLSLLETRCCSEQATGYLKHAHRLFPSVNAYRAGYLQALKQVAVNEGESPDL